MQKRGHGVRQRQALRRLSRSPARVAVLLAQLAMRTNVNIGAENAQPSETDVGDPRDQIARLESRLEDLAESLVRCRKISLISRIAIAGGGTWLLAMMIGVIGMSP